MLSFCRICYRSGMSNMPALPVKLLPEGLEAQLAYIKSHPDLNESDRHILGNMVETRQNLGVVIQNNTLIKSINARAEAEVIAEFESPLKLSEFRTPRYAFAKLGYKALGWLFDPHREHFPEWSKENIHEHDQDIDIKQAALVRFFDRVDGIMFETAGEKLSPTGKRIWNELADATRRETHPRFPAHELSAPKV